MRPGWLILLGGVLVAVGECGAQQPAPFAPLIGYTELRTNLEGGRHANVVTMRAKVVDVAGTEARMIAPELAAEPHHWTQFAGWSPDGETAIVLRGWESPENAQWEEEHRTFRFTSEGWLMDTFLVDLQTRQALNVTAVERVSFYNAGVFYWPGDPARLGFTALIDGQSHPFSMSRDGRNKRDLTSDSRQFTYGFQASRDGRRIAYHKDYQIYLADADGRNATRIETGHAFNFGPSWSPDGAWLLFVSGEHYNCHPYIVRADGQGLRKLADRHGYRGVTLFLDVPDYHEGSSDTPQWAVDGKSVYYTARVTSTARVQADDTAAGEETVELFQVSLEGVVHQLTQSTPGTTHYHPVPAPDGRWLAYGSKRDGVRQLFVRDLQSQQESQLTSLMTGSGALWPHWQPRPEVPE